MNKRNIIVILIILLIVIFTFLLFKELKKNNNLRNSINGTNDFNVKIIKKVEEINNDNYLISPYSIKMALNILKDGGKSSSSTEIENLIGDNINEIGLSKGRISIANALFIKDYYKDYIEDDYYKKTNKYNADIIYDKFDSPDVINNWVNEKTFEMIPSILDDINEDFVLGIANALAIDVLWLNDFSCENTIKEEFIKSDNSKIDVEMMHQKFERNIEYFLNKDSKGVIIPYRIYDELGEENNEGVSLEFIGILPNNEIKNYINNIDINKINEIDNIKKSLDENTELYLSIPRFKYDYEIKDFIKLLKDLGIKSVFDEEKSDLTGIISRRNMNKLNIDNIYVSDAIHKTFIDFNESGTKAAAVTYFGIEKSSAMFPIEKEKIEIKFNKPFVYMIRDKKTKEILFFGKVETPNKWNGSTCTDICSNLEC